MGRVDEVPERVSLDELADVTLPLAKPMLAPLAGRPLGALPLPPAGTARTGESASRRAAPGAAASGESTLPHRRPRLHLPEIGWLIDTVWP